MYSKRPSEIDNSTYVLLHLNHCVGDVCYWTRRTRRVADPMTRRLDGPGGTNLARTQSPPLAAVPCRSIFTPLLNNLPNGRRLPHRAQWTSASFLPLTSASPDSPHRPQRLSSWSAAESTYSPRQQSSGPLSPAAGSSSALLSSPRCVRERAGQTAARR